MEPLNKLIIEALVKYFKQVDIKKFGVNNGYTQQSERLLIQCLEEIFKSNNITYTKAGSQQPKDFRNINNTNKNIEVKILTSKFKIIFNDTLPVKDTDYLVFFTGKFYKKCEYKPQILLINGEKFIEGSKEWIKEANELLTKFKDIYCRGDNKKQLPGIMNCYARPTWSSTIFPFIDKDEFIVYKNNE
jgi:hypothetical protein